MKDIPSTSLLALLLGSLRCCLLGHLPRPRLPKKKPNVIILKLDDLTRVSPNFNRVLDFLKTRNIHSSVGIIANSLEGTKDPYYAWIKGENDGGLVEFWYHGYDHKM